MAACVLAAWIAARYPNVIAIPELRAGPGVLAAHDGVHVVPTRVQSRDRHARTELPRARPALHHHARNCRRVATRRSTSASDAISQMSCTGDTSVLQFAHEDVDRETARSRREGSRGRVPQTTVLEVRHRPGAADPHGPFRRIERRCKRNRGSGRISERAARGSQRTEEGVSQEDRIWPEAFSLMPGSSSRC